MRSLTRYLLGFVVVFCVIVAAVACVRETGVDLENREFGVVVGTGNADHGQVTVSHEKARAGTIVTVSAEAVFGYVFSKWEVVSGDVILHPTANPARFTMPAGGVEVKAEFVEKPGEPEPEPKPAPEYGVSVTGDQGGSVVADKEKAKEGDQVRVYAVAAVGYRFTGWTVVGGELTPKDAKANPLAFVMPACDVAVKAGFVVGEGFGVKVATGENGEVAADKEMAMAGEVVTLTATPAQGFVFSKWEVVSGDAILKAAENPTMFTMPAGDVEIGAVFVPVDDSYGVIVESDGHGVAQADVAVAGQGDVVKVTATPFAGYEFSRWSVVSGAVVLSEVGANPVSFVMPAGEVKLRAEFVDAPEPEPEPEPEYGVSAYGDGNGSVVSDRETAEAGVVVTLKATAAVGYEFARWVVVGGNVILNAALNPAKFNMPAGDVEIRAEFAPVKVEHAVAVSNDGNGAGSADPAAATQGGRVTLTAAAKDGYVFSKWRVVSGAVTDLTANSNPGTFTMPDGAVEIGVEFAVKPPDENSITVINDGNGTAYASETIAKAGVTVYMSATPNPGYEFSRWVVTKGEDTAFLNDDRSPSARFVMPAATVELRAEFSKTVYSVVVSDDGHGTAQADKTGATMQEMVTLTVDPDPGYEFSRWVLMSGAVADLVPGAYPGTFTMPIGDVAVKAEFVLKDIYINVTNDSKGTASADRPTAKMGETVQLTATPRGSDYLFKGWKVLSGGVTVEGGMAASFTLSSEDVEVLAQFVHIPREPFILHLDSNGRLAAGQFSDTATRDNILFFKLGSLVGVTTPASLPNGTSWAEGRAQSSLYNPSPIADEQFFAPPPPPPPHQPALSSYNVYVPGYNMDGIADISRDTYNTIEKALAGKGDPCRLIGLTAEEVLAMIQAGTLSGYDSGFRTPGYAEMEAEHVNGGSTWATIDGMGGRWKNSAPDASSFLPAMGDRSGGGTVEDVGMMGAYWTSNGINETYGGGRCLNFDETMNQIFNPPWAYGFPIRCVRE